MDKRAIGVFDSGVGGLTTVKELRKILPHEDIVYLGDTARVPYGTKGKKIIQKYAVQDINFLLSKNVKMIIIACGTVSSNLPTAFMETLEIPYTGVLTPAVQKAVKSTKNKKIGVIATPATTKSNKYGSYINELDPEIETFARACPMLVPLVENGYIDRGNKITVEILKEYLENIIAQNVDTVILGCTHYPLLKATIGDLVGEDVVLVDPGKESAKYALDFLSKNNMLNHKTCEGVSHYYVSDDVKNFVETASVFLDDDVYNKIEKIDIEKYPTH